MQVELRAYTGLEKFFGARHGEKLMVDIDANTTISDVLKRYGIPPAQVSAALVDGRHRALDYCLQPGERVALFPPVGGG